MNNEDTVVSLHKTDAMCVVLFLTAGTGSGVGLVYYLGGIRPTGKRQRERERR